MPQLRRQYTDQGLILAEPCDEAGAAAPYEPADGRRREDTNTTKRIRSEMIGYPLWGVWAKKARRIRSAIRLLASLLDPERKNT